MCEYGWCAEILLYNITAYNKTGSYNFNLTTGSNGYTAQTIITEYINSAGTKTYHTPYNIYALNSSYLNTNHSWNVTLKHNTLDVFTLGMGYNRAINQNPILSMSSGRTTSGFRKFSNSFSVNGISSYFQKIIRRSEQLVDFSDMLTVSKLLIRSIINNLHFTNLINKLTMLVKILNQNILIDTNVLLHPNLIRDIGNSVSFESILSRTTQLSLFITNGFNMQDNVQKVLGFTTKIYDGIIFDDAVNRFRKAVSIIQQIIDFIVNSLFKNGAPSSPSTGNPENPSDQLPAEEDVDANKDKGVPGGWFLFIMICLVAVIAVFLIIMSIRYYFKKKKVA